MTEPFRNDFSRTIFKQKYAHEGAETWHELSQTVVDDVCRDKMSTTDKGQLVEFIRTMKFIPGGRYLAYAGRQNKFFNNCLGGESSVLTRNGMQRLADVAGQTVEVLSPVDGEFYPAKIHNHGVQSLNRITFCHVRGRSTKTWTIRATAEHRWPLKDGSVTHDLRVGDVVPANRFAVGSDALGFAHGVMFGDGNAQGQVRLCGPKAALVPALQAVGGTVTYPPTAQGDPVVCFPVDSAIDWKSRPTAQSAAYKASFIEGWLATDGSTSPIKSLSSVTRENLKWFEDNCPLVGIVAVGQIRSQVRDVRIGKCSYSPHEIFNLNYRRGDLFQGFKVLSIMADSREEVFCPEEPTHRRFVTDGGIDTGNCYLLRAEEDTRLDWAELSWKSEMCLTTGGGIGADYSVYRPRGARLSRTGGTASGPVSKMKMINEIGRGVMQGGSRRSAIYASLNWAHPDAPELLHAKDWETMMVPGTNLSLKDLKALDFNWPAPLDFTNVSLNYDDAWLYKPFRECDPIFLNNVRQALRSGEPGFSFNFGDKQKETLRNACTEVTSEDDSDVCNLGSINMSRISSLLEFSDVVRLGTMFLLCGTLVADLPYQKVRDVREKNRRLGLGLMGMHEWLVQRSFKYEVVPEMHQWLGVYQAISDQTSALFADKLGVSRPVANRAIAPTGTIGILAGTTTGIEPVFAVAYKRRYLKDGKDWHFQYVVDSMAKDLIEVYGVTPDSIESAIDLAAAPERRLKFQFDVQKYVDMAISSTINLPAWGTELNNEDRVGDFAAMLSLYAPGLRGFTVYPDGSRGGQPLTSVSYDEAKESVGVEFLEHDVCVIGGKGGSCGV